MTRNGASPYPGLALTGRGRRIVIDASGEGPFQIPCYVILSAAKDLDGRSDDRRQSRKALLNRRGQGLGSEKSASRQLKDEERK